jgi:hypothetical protein
MKVRIYKYPSWFGVYQLVEKLPINEEKASALANKIEEKVPQLNRFFKWLYDKRIRKDKIIIEPFDTWSADYTLSKIIVPVLKQLKEDQHGAPNVDNEDVPIELQKPKELPEHDIDENHFKRWEYILNRMIQAFEYDIQDQDNEHLFLTLEEYKEKEAYAAEGRRLFAKYYNGLWD